MHLKGRIRRLLSASSGPSGNSGRKSDVSEDSSISYDRSSGSFVQRVTTSLRSRSGRLRRTSSEGGAREDSFDNSSLFPEESSIQQITPPKYTPQLPPIVSGAPFVEPISSSPVVSNQPPAGTAPTTLQDKHTTAMEGACRRPALIQKHGGGEDSITWEDGPSPQERQKSQDLVAAWLDTSRHRETTTPLLDIPEDAGLSVVPVPPVRQTLRMLDAISEDEVPDFVGSSTISTAPSTPMIPQMARSRSRSPPLRRRSLEGQEEFPMRGLDTIQETADPVSTAPRRRSLESAKRPPLESIPEAETAAVIAPKRRLVLKGLGLQRSESEPVIARNRHSPKRKTTTPPILSLSTIGASTAGKPTKDTTSVGSMPRSPSLPGFQRDAGFIMGQRSKSSPGPRKPLNLPTNSLGSIALQASIIEDDESRRLSEVAYLI